MLPLTVIGLRDLSSFLFHPEAMKQTENLITFMHLFCFKFLLFANCCVLIVSSFVLIVCYNFD